MQKILIKVGSLFLRHLSKMQRNNLQINAHYFFDRLFKYKEIMFQPDPKSNMNPKIALKKSSLSRHSGSVSGPNLPKTQEGMEFQ